MFGFDRFEVVYVTSRHTSPGSARPTNRSLQYRRREKRYSRRTSGLSLPPGARTTAASWRRPSAQHGHFSGSTPVPLKQVMCHGVGASLINYFWHAGMRDVWNALNHRLLKWVKWEKGLYKYAAVRWLQRQYKERPNHLPIGYWFNHEYLHSDEEHEEPCEANLAKRSHDRRE